MYGTRTLLARLTFPLATPFLLLLSLAPSAVAENSIEALIGEPVYSDVKISPDGDHIAIRFLDGGRHVLNFIERQSFKPVGGVAFDGRREVGEFDWVNDRRVVTEIIDAPLGASRPYFYGELFATDVDGKRTDIIFGYRPTDMQTGSHIERRRAERAWGEVIDVLPEDPDYILISATPWPEGRARPPQAKRLHVIRGTTRGSHGQTKHPFGKFYTDSKGEVRLMTSVRDDGARHVQVRPPGSEDWSDIPEEQYTAAFRPVALGGDSSFAFVLDVIEGDKLGLYRMTFDTAERTKVYVHDRVDITDVTKGTDGRSAYAFRVDDGYPSYLIFSPDHPEAEVFKQLLATFSGNLVSITSKSNDGRFWIIRAISDVNPGTFYLYDQQESSIGVLVHKRPGVDSAGLSPVEPVSFPSDGVEIPGYFTKAAGIEGTAPLVVLLHDEGTRDYWAYDPEVQALAASGFSVLQINFRGSTGYGKAFEDARARATRDVIEGTKWAVESGRAQQGKICIMGTGYGANVGVVSALQSPKLFNCVVANAGAYDSVSRVAHVEVPLFLSDGKLGQRERTTVAELPPEDIEVARALVEGQRSDAGNTMRVKEVLDAGDKPYEWLAQPAGDGLYDSTGRVEHFKRVRAFLKKHL